MSHRRAALYLQIPASYCRAFGGLRWAQYGEAVEFLDGPDAGRTFAFAGQIGQFLEGVLADGEWCPAFGTALHLLCALGVGDRSDDDGRTAAHRHERIAGPFRELGRPLRNAGALCAWLCRELPGVPDPPELADLFELLNGGSWIPQMVMSHPMLGAMDYAEQPSAEPSALDALLTARVQAMSDLAIRHWLMFGRGQMAAAMEVEVPLPPGGLVETLALVEERPRLSGLARLVSRLEGALSLPARRLDHDGTQADGYWDLATRGAPEQILPIQFALEDEEFLRRFAERELLYFHRERPSRPVVQELVLLLDQGVRTWGDVRLFLAAGAMAMARQAGRRELAVRLATSGEDGPVDPSSLSPELLGRILEASDLTASPARSLSRVLREGPGTPRDVVLLTHPRTLADPEVVAVAAGPEVSVATRLFAVAADESGEVELSELRRGRPVAIGRCRVSLSGPSPARPPGRIAANAGPPIAWRGDVEPIPFPFRCGLLGKLTEVDEQSPRMVAFDEAGARVFAVLYSGMVCAARVDGSQAEVLPRPTVGGVVVAPIGGLVGVTGGVVAIGRYHQKPVLSHYDFARRICVVHTLPGFARGVLGVAWTYYPDLHCIAGRPDDRRWPCMAVDLSADGEDVERSTRATRALERARAGLPAHPLADPALKTHASEEWVDRTYRDVRLDAATGTLTYQDGAGTSRSLTPMSDGRPALEWKTVTSIQQGGDVLAVQVRSPSGIEVWFIAASRTAVIGCFQYDVDGASRPWFALSRDGRRFARRMDPHRIEVREVPGDRAPRATLGGDPVRYHDATLGRSCLLVRESEQFLSRTHAEVLIRWGLGRLTVHHDDAARTFQQLGGPVAESASLAPFKSMPPYDRVRLARSIQHGELRILIDAFNHIAVLGRDDRVVAMFYVCGPRFAAWIPDGTRMGTGRLIGGEPSKDAAERIAAALRAAERGEGGTS